MAKLITVYWRDIPAQVIAKRGRETAKAKLAARFQEAIDRAAMRAGKGSSDKYLEDWRRGAAKCGGDLGGVGRAAA
ncbi:MAG: virulence factor, partial [Gammaproteobacteria bacterium]